MALAAGIVGVAMVLAPGSTGRYFSWQLDPPPLAALVGACYLASAPVFGWAAFRERWTGQRGLCVAVLGLAGPTLVATARHRDVFDFDRWQAVAWVLLFVASVTSFGTLASSVAGQPAARRSGAPPGRRPGLCSPSWPASTAGAAAVLWADPYWVSAHGPIAAGPLGLRFMGSWAAFLAIGAVYAATHRRWEEARMNVLALAVVPARRPRRDRGARRRAPFRPPDRALGDGARRGARGSRLPLVALAGRAVEGCQPAGPGVDWYLHRRGVEQSGSSSGS